MYMLPCKECDQGYSDITQQALWRLSSHTEVVVVGCQHRRSDKQCTAGSTAMDAAVANDRLQWQMHTGLSPGDNQNSGKGTQNKCWIFLTHPQCAHVDGTQAAPQHSLRTPPSSTTQHAGDHLLHM